MMAAIGTRPAAQSELSPSGLALRRAEAGMRLRAGISWIRALWAVVVVTVSFSVLADDLTKIDITIKDHRFSPSEIHVPVGKPIVLHIKNEDPTPEEFDSSALRVEKVIVGGRSATVRLRPLGAGRYPFMGEYHSATAQGIVISE